MCTPSDKKYRGVSWKPKNNRWRAKIGDLWIGYFREPEDAAHAYDIAAKFLHGPQAVTNFPFNEPEDRELRLLVIRKLAQNGKITKV